MIREGGRRIIFEVSHDTQRRVLHVVDIRYILFVLLCMIIMHIEMCDLLLVEIK